MSIYVIGHKSPDLDSVAAAISYANLKNRHSQSEDYVPAIAGEPNKETVYILEKFGFQMPERIDDLRGKEVILVDHNEFQQAAVGIEEAKIIEIIDHHKFDFKYAEPIAITVKPWGATNTILTEMYFENNIALENGYAKLMLAAIMVDTVITKSPTCTDKDREAIEKLSMLAGIPDWEAFGMEIFKVRSSVGELSDDAIVHNDFKDFNTKLGKVGVGQVETVDLTEAAAREDALLAELDKIRTAHEYHTVILFITDIIKEGSQFLVASADIAKFEQAFGVKTENGKVYIPGILSRKKQVAPKLLEVFDR